MGGVFSTIEADTKSELRKIVLDWQQQAKAIDFEIRLGWDPKRAVKTDTGYVIMVWAHS